MEKCMLDEAKFRVLWAYSKTLKNKFGQQELHSFQKNKIANKREAVMVMLLNELIDSDDEKYESGYGEKKMNISLL